MSFVKDEIENKLKSEIDQLKSQNELLVKVSIQFFIKNYQTVYVKKLFL